MTGEAVVVQRGGTGNALFNSDEQLMGFAQSYHAWKKNGYYPVEIREMLMGKYDITSSTYYKYLRVARQKGFITDTYEQTQAKSIEARREWMLKNGGLITGVKFYFPRRVVKGQLQTNAETTTECTSSLKAFGRKVRKLIIQE